MTTRARSNTRRWFAALCAGCVLTLGAALSPLMAERERPPFFLRHWPHVPRIGAVQGVRHVSGGPALVVHHVGSLEPPDHEELIPLVAPHVPPAVARLVTASAGEPCWQTGAILRITTFEGLALVVARRTPPFSNADDRPGSPVVTWQVCHARTFFDFTKYPRKRWPESDREHVERLRAPYDALQDVLGFMTIHPLPAADIWLRGPAYELLGDYEYPVMADMPARFGQPGLAGSIAPIRSLLSGLRARTVLVKIVPFHSERFDPFAGLGRRYFAVAIHEERPDGTLVSLVDFSSQITRHTQ